MVIVNDSHHGGFFGITEIFCVEHGVQVKGVSLVLDFNHTRFQVRIVQVELDILLLTKLIYF